MMNTSRVLSVSSEAKLSIIKRVYCLLDEILLIEKIDRKRFLNIIREAVYEDLFAFVYKLFKLLKIIMNIYILLLPHVPYTTVQLQH